MSAWWAEIYHSQSWQADFGNAGWKAPSSICFNCNHNLGLNCCYCKKLDAAWVKSTDCSFYSPRKSKVTNVRDRVHQPYQDRLMSLNDWVNDDEEEYLAKRREQERAERLASMTPEERETYLENERRIVEFTYAGLFSRDVQ